MQSKWLLGLLLTLCFMFIGLVSGTMIGSRFVPEGSGLAGPAIALGYGVLGAVICAIPAVLIARQLELSRLQSVLRITAIITVSVLAVLVVRAIMLNRVAEPASPPPTVPAPTKPARLLSPVANQNIGLGLVMPLERPGASLYFYGQPDVDQMASDLTPSDSLTFVRRQHFIDIATAPPWFFPEQMKMDYNVLMLRAFTLSRNWIEVEVNRQTGRRAWVDRHAVRFIHWPEFLLDVNSVEVLEPSTNPIRTKPHPDASILHDATDAILRPLAIQDDWLMVYTGELADRMPPTGYVRWREEAGLALSYNLFE